MKETVTKAAMWNEAAQAGLVLGLISAAYLFLTQFLSGESSVPRTLSMVVNWMLWIAKVGGCIWAMMVFMRKFAGKYAATNKNTFNFGLIAALCSALIVAACNLANVLLINPDLVGKQIDAFIGIYGSMLDSNTLNSLDKVEAIMPQVTFFTNLIYCFLYGLIVSYFLSKNIPPRTPFTHTEYYPDQSDDQTNNPDEQ